ncbi:MAG: hypothetical protein E5Y10_09295 [Mesorhizobium sp.]|uniref:hypothetical protein n=1 Tax=Mesorhizobium sp. TaxID=1871066 RepID=UPI0012113DF2|nr:hypothetical protein [Mesorhizobium sp.]TIN40402.1 MAG: hypothetical protein E5Y13_11460 [Mesorhizobium sp.]TJU90630.1 MAG: hypothetical protein E5Y10_09295 [Mesorhizobium sp.]
MPRHRRHEQISEYHLANIERQASLLKRDLRDAQLALKPFHEHWEVLDRLHGDLKRALNLLNGRPADWERPHAAPMSRG